MNFLLRSSQTGVPDQPLHESTSHTQDVSKPTATLGGLISEDPFPHFDLDDDHGADGAESSNGSLKRDSNIVENYSDVNDDEGWITIPHKELLENWNDAPDISLFRSLDRSFVFPGEQIHILACLSASKQDTEIITPFKVAAMMSNNGLGESTKTHIVNSEPDVNSFTSVQLISDGEDIDQNEENPFKEKIDPHKEVFAGESLRIEDYKKQTETLLQRFKNSHFLVRIAESGEQLWSKRYMSETSDIDSQIDMTSETKTRRNVTASNAVIDRGNFNPNVSGGLARTVSCCSLSNGDIVVLLQVNVGIDIPRDPVLEILQFEKFQDKCLSTENLDHSIYEDQDPCGELLKWLLPLDNSTSPPARPLSSVLSSNSGIGNTSQKSNNPTSSSSQLFSFGHFRSYSMSSLPQNNSTPQPLPVTTPLSRPNLDMEDRDQKLLKTKKIGTDGLLSFRGVSLHPERFSVHCGLEGIYIPGRRWKKKIEIIQLVEINTFSADCNTDDLLCVQIKNISPEYTFDIVVFLDAITIVFEEASTGGPPTSLPIACIEAGNDNSLPNLPLRRGEEHSFILKPVTSVSKNLKIEKGFQSSHVQTGRDASSLRLPSKIIEGNMTASTTDQYAVLVSCRCNYSESRLFFKKLTNWRPRISRDLMITVTSEMSKKSVVPNGGVSQLPIQVLTLQASNLTSEDITLTVLAPASFTLPPSVVSLNSSPTTPMSPFIEFSEVTVQKTISAPILLENQNADNGAQTLSLKDPDPKSDVLPPPDLGCTHLWLQSRVPLGCVPSQSMATIKLELLPLTDGIITLDTLQIDAKEKGLTYVPEQSLKINSTSSLSSGIL